MYLRAQLRCLFGSPSWVWLGVVAALAGCGSGSGAAVTDTAPPDAAPPADASSPPDTSPPSDAAVPIDTMTPLVSCAELVGMMFTPAQLTLATGGGSVTEATAVAASDAGNVLGDYCRVRGTILPVDPQAPAIQFAVNLPKAWNHKVIHFGGGGFDGTLIDGTETVRFGPAEQAAPLALGYATYGDDAGHQSSSITDGTFALNDEALANYGGLSLKKTHDVARLVVTAFYGSAPVKAYFLGTSTGGRDALLHIQRWPADYDGVIANEPALNYAGTRLSNLAVGRALYRNAGAGWVNLSKTLLVQNTVRDACDKLDGVVDGIVSNVESCRQLNSQILAQLRCSGGGDTGDNCLSDPQLDTIRAIESPLDFTSYALAHGVTRAGGYNLLEGALVAGPFTTRDLGTRRVPGNPATTADANMYVTGDQWAKYFVTRDPNLDSLTVDPLDPGALAARVTAVSALTDATDPDLAPFLSHGGRLILLHGLADEVISNNSTIDYYHRVIATVGQAAVDQGIRFYTVPGMGHGTGVFLPSWDSLGALEAWVERGVAPSTAVVTDTVAATYGRARPLCLYPAWPRFKGSGSVDAAVNYRCVTEVGDPLACPNLPAGTTHYKGGDVLGEELSVVVDPGAQSYTVAIDASVQRAAGTTRTGLLQSLGNCRYASDELGATFVFGAGGVLQGGVAAPVGAGFVPLIGFATTFQNAATPTVFNSVAAILNAVGVGYGAAGVATAYAASTRVRNAGTFQSCQDPGTGGFFIYDPACTSTAKGYLTYSAAHGAFDVFTTSPTGPATTTGGVLSGSAIFGLVGAVTVPVFLVRESATSYGMRLYAPQLTVAAGALDGRFLLATTGATQVEATVAGAALDLGGATGALAFNAPVLGVVQSSGAVAADVITAGGVLGVVSTTGPAFALGVNH
jgi:feruloyl esterase